MGGPVDITLDKAQGAVADQVEELPGARKRCLAGESAHRQDAGPGMRDDRRRAAGAGHGHQVAGIAVGP
jgi:hypothetical protein